jgi:hypothetical protein
VWGLLLRHLGWTTTTKKDQNLFNGEVSWRLASYSALMTSAKTNLEIIY